jgi:type IV pilus assembly protein PilV
VKNLETPGRPGHPLRQSGFSMVEMLMAAFILAIGLLGLAMLQAMSLRSTTGSKSVTSGILVAERVLDQAQALGRNSLLCSRTGSTVPTLSPNYFGASVPTQYYDYNGTYNAASSYYTVTITPADVVAAVSGVGGIKLLTVTVSWNEVGNGTGGVISRNVTLSRRIPYANS